MHAFASNIVTTAGQKVTASLENIEGELIFSLQYGAGIDQLIDFDLRACEKLHRILSVALDEARRLPAAS